MRISDWSSDVCSSDLVGVRRGEDASWLPAQSPAQLTQAVHDNLRNLGLDRLNVVNLRLMGDVYAPTSDEQLEEQFRSEEHTSELQSLMRISYAVFCLKKKKKTQQ